jgi:hypothetical protein
MKANEARILFRILAAFIGLFAWFGLAFFLFIGEFRSSGAINWRVILVFLALGVSFSYVAIAGYLPKLLLRLLSLRRVADPKDLR